MKRIIALILCAVLLSASFCGCDRSLVSGSFFSRTPAVALVDEYPYELPVIINALWGKSASDEIQGYLTPLTDALKQVNSEGIIACTAYELNNTDSGSELAVYVDSTQTSGRILLTTFYISSEGDVAPPEDYMTDYLYNRALLDGHLRLSRYGMSPEFSASGSWLTTADVCRVLIDYYEASTGKEVDTSRVDLGVADEYFIKSIALGLCSDSFSYYDTSYPVYTVQLNSMLTSLMSHIFTDHLGRSSLFISPEELTDAINLYFRLYFSIPANSNPRIISTSGSDLSHLEGISELTRNDICITFNNIYENCFAPLEHPTSYFFYDYSTDDAETAYYMGFIDNFPSYMLSSCDYYPRQYQLFSMVDEYVESCYLKDSHATFAETPADSKALLYSLGYIDSYLDSFTAPAGNAVIVDNSRNYQWYFAQFNTGEYSDVNCMPTITAMGIKWYFADSAVTVADVRSLWLPDYDSGWYMSQVADSLDYYGVPYEWHDMSESLTEQLDKGCIILTQMSEAAYDASGHCFVIYGYRKLGDSVQYMIHDPGIYDGFDSFGKPPGESMLLDSGYVEWIIQRMTYSYITVG